MDRFFKHHSNKTKNLSVVIWDGEDEIQTGARLSSPSRLKRIIVERHTYTEIYVPVMTYVLSVLAGYGQPTALLQALAALLTMLLWVVIVAFATNAYKYEHTED